MKKKKVSGVAEKSDASKNSAKKNGAKKEKRAKVTTLRSQMIAAVTSIFLVTIVLTVAAGIISSTYAIKNNVREDMGAISQVAEKAVSSEIRNLKSNAESMARIYDAAETDGQMAAFIRVKKSLADYGFSDAAIIFGQNVLKTDEFLSNADLLSDPCVQQAKSGKAAMSTTRKLKDGSVRFFVAAPTSTGCVLLTVDAQYFSDQIKDVVVGTSGNVFMIDADGVMIASKNPQLVEEQQNFIEKGKTDPGYEATAAVYTRMINGETGVDEYSYETGARICAFRPVTEAEGWSVGAVAPMREMTASIVYIVMTLLLCSIVCMVVGVILVGKYVTSVANPIREATERMYRLAQGDLSSEVKVSKRKDEIGTLTGAFYETVEALKSYIKDIDNVLREISKGNLLVMPQADFRGEFTEIRKSMDQILDSLNETFHEFLNATSQVSSSAAQFSAGAQTLSQGATEQASSVEELAATINEINDSISSSANSAVQANQRVYAVGQEAEESNRQMNEMLQAMTDIKTASDQIDKIIKTIEDIAFQTNILALNAAVEAARAGSAGKGFAVVADEVRNLAGKSAEASKDTAALIENALNAVHRGTGIADKTAQSLMRVVNGVNEVNKTVTEISDNAAQEASSAAQINQGIEQISGVVQTNSATAEESAATSDDLLRQAQTLLELMQKFKIR